MDNKINCSLFVVKPHQTIEKSTPGVVPYSPPNSKIRGLGLGFLCLIGLFIILLSLKIRVWETRRIKLTEIFISCSDFVFHYYLFFKIKFLIETVLINLIINFLLNYDIITI